MTGDLLAVRECTAYLGGPRGVRRILSGVSLRVRPQRTFALLGESGSGKTFLFHSLLGLHPGTPGVVAGEAELLGVPLFRRFSAPGDPSVPTSGCGSLTRALRRRVAPLLGHAVTLIPQDALTSLPPFFSVGTLLARALRRVAPEGTAATGDPVVEWLERVHIHGAADVARRFVHELSGGMAQRVALALALAPGPRLVVADEPTTGLDATLRVKVLELLAEAAGGRAFTLCLVTHDLEAARLLARDVAVLCSGTVVEIGPAETVLDPGATPKHPYTASLLRAEQQLERGTGPDDAPPDRERDDTGARDDGGCVYRTRCSLAVLACARLAPAPRATGPEHWISCPEVTG